MTQNCMVEGFALSKIVVVAVADLGHPARALVHALVLDPDLDLADVHPRRQGNF